METSVTLVMDFQLRILAGVIFTLSQICSVKLPSCDTSINRLKYMLKSSVCTDTVLACILNSLLVCIL
jgi:hypothetical protein